MEKLGLFLGLGKSGDLKVSELKQGTSTFFFPEFWASDSGECRSASGVQNPGNASAT